MWGTASGCGIRGTSRSGNRVGQPGNGGREVEDVRSEQAQIGARVRVREDHRKTNCRGQVGTIAKRWGDPNYTALDVLLDGCGKQLFWHHELEEISEQ